NASLWSLRYEILCYGIVALIGIVGARWTVASALLLAAGVAGEAVTSWSGVGTGVPATLARLTACFFGGGLLYALRRRVPFSSLLALAAVAALAAGALIGGFRLLFPIAGTYLLLFLACWPALPLQGFGRYGDFSYGLYVFAYPIQQTIVQAAGTGISMPLFFGLAFVPTLVLAALSWHFIEAPSLARKPRRASVRTAPAPCPTGPAWPVTSPGGPRCVPRSSRSSVPHTTRPAGCRRRSNGSSRISRRVTRTTRSSWSMMARATRPPRLPSRSSGPSERAGGSSATR